MLANHVLVVEDDQDIADVLVDVLRMEGFAAEVAPSGEAALARLQRPPAPTIVLLDLWLPGMSGYGVQSSMARQEDLAAIPVVMMSAAPASKPPCVHALLAKPFSADRLCAALRTAIQSPSGLARPLPGFVRNDRA